MCIRDRCCGLPRKTLMETLRFAGDTLYSSIILFFNWKSLLVFLSYIYLSTPILFPFIRPVLCMDNHTENSRHSRHPVSYTHLDVYKRQPLLPLTLCLSVCLSLCLSVYNVLVFLIWYLTS